ncbi:nuclear transport factor 2 family protein [Candidatus Poriferisocius sp.]|uniref:nuclear transport factor 2 family protein n=1 Tax=Candidatus Poriferisocius sp. TaxID=3101276 RepID=UPI003B5AB92F
MNPKMNPNKTWRLVAERLEGETNPRRRHVLELVLAHMKCEAQADIEGVVATLSDKPRYVIWSDPDDPVASPHGSKDAIRGFYNRTIVQTGAHRLEFDCDRVIVDDDAVFTEGVMRMAYPGQTLVAMGIEVEDPDSYYLAQSRMGIVWPVDLDDPEARLTGEEVYSGGSPFDGIADRPISLEDIAPLELAGV